MTDPTIAYRLVIIITVMGPNYNIYNNNDTSDNHLIYY